jgi:tRNA U34 5-methylaminomethyl-2-thiouridine-forming methyltransferase MnmC
MTGPNDTDPVDWTEGGTPVSSRFGDPYFSKADGLAETRFVYLAANDLPARFRDGFRIAELGFGTGLNLIAAIIAWEASGTPGRLSYTSFEAFPMPPADMARAHAAFPETAEVSTEILSHWSEGARAFTICNTDVTVITGDARVTLPAWQGKADAWFLDGFAPAKNPELWSPSLMAEVARHTASGGTFATYTAAGDLRRALQAAGFQVSRVPGYGTKRHMTRGILTPES